jgi:signal transduction histidine kinase/ligand-binding sensor domain-containing protein
VAVGCKNADSSLPPVPSARLRPITLRLDTVNGYLLNQLTGDSVKPLRNAKGEPVITGRFLSLTETVKDTLSFDPAKGQPFTWKFVARARIPRNAVPATFRTVPVDEKQLRRFRTGIDSSDYVLREFDTVVQTGVPLPVTLRRVPVKMPENMEAREPTMIRRGEYVNKSLDVYHGLKSANVSSVITDRKGRLWIGSFEGLSCYDGGHILHFTTENGLLDDRVLDLMEDSRGRIWIKHYGGKVSRFDGNGFDHITFRTEISGGLMGDHRMVEDKNGNVWVAGMTAGVAKFDSATVTHYTRKEGMPGNGVRTIYQDKKGNLWFGTHGQGACRYDGREFTWFTRKDGLNHNVVSAIVDDPQGNIWFGTDSGMTRYDGAGMTQYFEENGLPFRFIGNLLFDSSGCMWISSYDKGLCTFDGRQFVAMNTVHGLTANSFDDLHLDKQGRIWAASEQGINLLYQDGIQRLTPFPDTLADASSSVVSDKSGGIYFSIFAAGFFKYSGDSLFKCSTGNDDLSGIMVTAVARRGEELWIGSNQGLACLFRGRLYRYHNQPGSSGQLIHDLLTAKTGRLWISTSHGLKSLDGNILSDYSRSEQLAGLKLNRLYEDTQGRIWLGTTSRGVIIIRQQQYAVLTEREGLAQNTVQRISEDRQGRIWLNTGMHVTVIDDTAVYLLTEKNGMPFRLNSIAAHDTSGNVWVSSITSIAMLPGNLFDPNDKAAQHKSGSDSRFMIIFGNRDGFKTQLQGSVLGSKGELRLLEFGVGFPQMVVDLKKVAETGPLPITQIGQVWLNEKHIDFTNTALLDSAGIRVDSLFTGLTAPSRIHLAHYQSELDIFYSSDQQVYGDPLEFTYYMKGLSTAWSMPTGNSHTHFQYLPPGQYTFYVKAKNRSGIWGPEAAMQIVIQPPWWRNGWAYLLYGLVAAAFIVSYTRWRTGVIRKRNIILEQQVKNRTGEFLEARDRAERSLKELKSAQAQLIQSEKMASLGELTAGIAHEIQNPLNFVNNFSEVNAELSQEMAEALNKGDLDEARQLAADIKSNQEKIRDHGKRAGSIVKSMLEHSRASSGQKEPTAVNAICDEYLRLAFHGMRAKDKTFNVKIETAFDPEVGSIEMVPQDIGRILLNLFNNAFYAVQEKSKLAGEGYQPVVTVKTFKTEASGNLLMRPAVGISVTDNGPGIPENIREKIFQPFFTTKPTGQGTGLGLSLSYDIVKAHGGELSVETTKGGGAAFTVLLPA